MVALEPKLSVLISSALLAAGSKRGNRNPQKAVEVTKSGKILIQAPFLPNPFEDSRSLFFNSQCGYFIPLTHRCRDFIYLLNSFFKSFFSLKGLFD